LAQEEVAEEEDQIPDPEEGEEGEEEKETAEELERIEEEKVETAVEQKEEAQTEEAQTEEAQTEVAQKEGAQTGGQNENNDYEDDELLNLIESDSNYEPNTDSNEEPDVVTPKPVATKANNIKIGPLAPKVQPPTTIKPLAPPPSTQPRTLRKRFTVATKLPTPPPEEEGDILNTLSEGLEAVVDAVQEQTVQRTLTYQERVKRAMQKLNENRNVYLKLDNTVPEGRLAQYSTKLDQMIRRILASKGSNLVYSQFKTVEGLGVLGVALKANGFTEIVIEGSDLEPRFSEETEASFRKGPQAKQKRFISFTGEGSRERRALILNVFNGNLDKLPTSMRDILAESGYGERKNNYGEICWVIGITGAGAEGISLKSCRSVHIMEPYWNNVRLDQVKGRAIRICSHSELPFSERDVEIYTYVSYFAKNQIEGNKIDMTIRTTDENETSDEKVFNVSVRKDKINQEILSIMKETAVDCQLNAPDNGEIACFEVDGRPDQYMFDPDLATDIMNTSIEITQDKKKVETLAPTQRALKETEKVDRKVQTVDVPVIEWEGQQYMIVEKPKSGGLVFNLYEMTDLRHRYPVGEIEVDPVDGSFDEPTFYNK